MIEVRTVPTNYRNFILGIPRSKQGIAGHWIGFYADSGKLYRLMPHLLGNFNRSRDNLRGYYEFTQTMDLPSDNIAKVAVLQANDYVFFRASDGNMLHPEMDASTDTFKVHPGDGLTSPLDEPDDAIELPPAPSEGMCVGRSANRSAKIISEVVTRANQEIVPAQPPVVSGGAQSPSGDLASVPEQGSSDENPDSYGRDMAQRFPAYWRQIPASFKFLDTYRVAELFPIDDPSGRLIHARKKLLVPGIRTGGKSLRKDVAEAYATLGAWLADNPE